MIRAMFYSTRTFSLLLALVLVAGALSYTDSAADEGSLSCFLTNAVQLDSDQLDYPDLDFNEADFLVDFVPAICCAASVVLSDFVSLYVLPETRAPPRFIA